MTNFDKAQLVIGGVYLLSVLCIFFGIGVHLSIRTKGDKMGKFSARLGIISNYLMGYGGITMNVLQLVLTDKPVSRVVYLICLLVLVAMYWNIEEHADMKKYRKIIKGETDAVHK